MEKKEREGELERGANKTDIERWRTGMQLETCDQREGGMQCVGEQDVEESQGGAQPCMLLTGAQGIYFSSALICIMFNIKTELTTNCFQYTPGDNND
ncbi:hypothetical protein NQZ68_034054 [Dissostichus eleginoides]|nr:hypothetical protein NQZ68_034054 [Dissostichus eleginoides]